MTSFIQEHCADGERICIQADIQQQKLIKDFLNVYLDCVKEKVLVRILKEAQRHLASTCVKASQVGYLVIAEKKTLDEIMGGKEELKHLMATSGLIEIGDNSKQMQIVTRGEGLLPKLQEKYNINLPLKTYYVQAQLYDDYIQLTLHQVVKIATAKEEEASTIIVQDRITSIEDIYDSLCRCILENIESDDADIDLVRLCEVHLENNTQVPFQQGNSCSLKCCTECLENLKKRLREVIVRIMSIIDYAYCFLFKRRLTAIFFILLCRLQCVTIILMRLCLTKRFS
jgi:hypothetical protein